MCLVAITNAILEDSNSIFTVSTYDPKHKCYYGHPSVVGRNGVKEVYDIDLTPADEEKLQASIDAIKGVMKTLK